MLLNDVVNNVKVVNGLTSAQQTATFTGVTIDGDKTVAKGVRANISAVAAADADNYFDLGFEESDDGSTWSEQAESFGLKFINSTAQAGTEIALPYDGIKRYFRLKGKETGTVDATLSAYGLLVPQALPV